MKRHLHILLNPILAAASLAAAACTTIVDIPLPDPDEVKVSFHIRTPRPATSLSRAVDADYAVESLDLLVFHQENGAPVYKYKVAGSLVSQDDNQTALFEALLDVIDTRVKLLAIANCPAGKLDALDGMTAPVTETQVREALTGDLTDADPASDAFVMTGDVVLAGGISATLTSITIPMMRTIAKVTIVKAPAVDNFDVASITVYRSADLAQYFPDVEAIVPPEGDASATPTVNAASVPAAAGYTQPLPVSFDNGLEGTFTTWLNENDANEVVDRETCIVVGGWYGGDRTKQTYYRMDFDTDDNAPIFNPMGQVLRNYVYRFTIESVAGPGWDTPDDAANHPASQLDARVLSWNGGGDPEYHFGDDRYVVLSRGGLNLDAEVGHTDALYITTSGLPFTITSERHPAVGALDTTDPAPTLTTDLMSFTLPRAGGAPAGQQRWLLTATALTADVIGDDLYLDAGSGLVKVRIPVRRTGDFSVDRTSALETVPVGGVRDRGGNVVNHVEYEIHIPDGMTWSARITEYGWSPGNNPGPQQGYLLDASNQPVASLPGQQPSSTLRVGFDRLYYPTVGESPRVTIEIDVDDHPEMRQTITVAQDMLPSMTGPLKVIDMYSSSYGSVQTTSYLARYSEYLKSSRLFGFGGVVRTTGPVSITATGTGTASIPASIDPSYRYVHIGGHPTNSYTQQRHDVVNSYWQQWGNERIFVYAIEQRTDGVFANAGDANTRRTTALSMMGVKYLQPSGTGYVAKITTDQDDRNSAVLRYLTQDGPFGRVYDYASFVYYNDGTSSGVDRASLPATAVPVIFDSRGVSGGCVMLFIDPAGGVVYWGDGQFFDVGSPAYRTADQLADQLNSQNRDSYSTLMANLLAYIINCAQYGTSFADLFVADGTGNYPLYEAAFPTPQPGATP